MRGSEDNLVETTVNLFRSVILEKMITLQEEVVAA